jgi:hypothetical protein
MAATIHPFRARKPNRRRGALTAVPLPAPGTPERAASMRARVDRAVAARLASPPRPGPLP